MNESEFNGGLSAGEGGEETLLPSSGNGRYRFYKVRLFGINHFVKRPSEEFIADYLTLEALRKEYYVGFQLNHSGIVRYIKFDGQSLYEEFIDGESLRELIDRKDERLKSRAFLADICGQILEATGYMHRMGVVHNDLKPENIMITRVGGKVKITDFGCAYIGDNDTTSGYTRGYMAPEQDKISPSAANDIFQIGKIMEELSEGGNMGKRWKKFTSKATNPEAERRFPSAESAARAIPRRGNRKPVYFTALFAIAAAIIFLTYPFKHENLPEVATQVNKEQTEPSTATKEDFKSRVATEETIKKPKEARNEKSETPAKSTETLLSDEISRYVADYYKRNVHPIVENPESFGFGPMSSEQMEALQSALGKAKSEAYSLGEKMKSKYPESSGFIDEEIWEAISREQTKTGVIYSQQVQSQQGEKE
ncbi:MAG: protein kinase [Paramuribaculum sp.]|nr:protein kinase [Paramuribaculum sp.]